MEEKKDRKGKTKTKRRRFAGNKSVGQCLIGSFVHDLTLLTIIL